MKLERGKIYHTFSHILSILDLTLEGRPDVFVIKYKWKKDAPNYKEYVCAFDIPPDCKNFLTEIVLGEYKEPFSQTITLNLVQYNDGSKGIAYFEPSIISTIKILGKKTVTITEGEGMSDA